MTVKPIEGDLSLVRELANTREVTPPRDAISTDEGLALWLASHGADDAHVTHADVTRLLELREALRDLMLANNGEDTDVEAATSIVDAHARRVGLAVRFSTRGAELATDSGGADAVTGRILAAVYEAMNDGRWKRMKSCRAHDCVWVFFDTARNASRVWCSMEVCGNREKARAFRRRATTATRAPRV